MSIYNTNFKTDQSTTHLDGRFVHSQLFIDCLLRMKNSKKEKDDFISYCLNQYHSNQQDLKIIQEFQDTYSSEKSIWWYTRDTFLYQILNQSLRRQNIDLLFGLRFFIRDIEQQLQKYNCHEQIRLYRGQFISNEELNILQQSIGNLISINSFFSTSIDPNVARLFFDPTNNENQNNKYQGVLFQIDAGPYRNGMKPFAKIQSLSSIPDENEVLMMLGSVFRLNKITRGQYHMWIIDLTLCSDQDHDLESVFQHMSQQYEHQQTRLLLFGHVLVDMARFDDAEKYYHRLLQEMKDNHRDLSNCYHSLGKVACEKGDYDSSLQWLEKSLKILENKLQKNHSRLGFIHTSIGEVYQRRQDYTLALKSYQKALEIWTNTYDNEHEYVAWCFNNIAIIYNAQKDYSQALEYLQKALNIKEKILPKKHPCLANSYLNLGNIYYQLREYDRALENYQLAHEIYLASLPAEHPSVACARKNIGIIYEKQGKHSQALECYQKSLIIRQQSFQSTHPDNKQIEKDIQRILKKINQ